MIMIRIRIDMRTFYELESRVSAGMFLLLICRSMVHGKRRECVKRPAVRRWA